MIMNVNDNYLIVSHYAFERMEKTKNMVCISDRCLDAEWINKVDNYPNIKICDVHETHLDSRKIYDQVIKMRDDIMDIMTPVLNRYHDVKHSADYWTAFSWFWMQNLIVNWIELYRSIEYVLQKYPDIMLVAYVDHKYDVAKYGHRENYSNTYIRQLLGLQLFKELAPNNNVIINNCKEYEELSARPITNDLSGGLKKYIWKIYRRLSRKAPINIMYNQIMKAKQLRLFFVGRVYWKSQGESIYITNEINSCAREKYIRFFEKKGGKSCEETLIKHLYENLPVMLWEDYSNIRMVSVRDYKYFPKVILYHGFDPVQMEFLARRKEQGTIIVMASHSFEEDFRVLPVSDKTAYDKKYIWIATHLCNEKMCLAGKSYFYDEMEQVDYKKNVNIIYFSYGMERYNGCAIAFDERESMNAKQMTKRNICFFRELNKQLRKMVIYRHRDSTNWGYVETLKKSFSEITVDGSFLENSFMSFENRIRSARMSIIESVHSSTFFHSLLYGVPAIIIDNNEYRGFFTDAVCDLLEPLKQVGVWVDTPEEAANIVNEHYDDIDIWWNDPKRKSVIDDICENIFANKNESIIKYWKKEYKLLKGLLDE